MTAVGKYKYPYGDEIRTIYSINEMPSYSDEADMKMEIPYMVLMPSQKITVQVSRDEIYEQDDIILWICRENPSKEIGRLPTMDEYRGSILKNGGVHLSFCQDKYNTIRIC